jgi:hypothetical protein
MPRHAAIVGVPGFWLCRMGPDHVRAGRAVGSGYGLRGEAVRYASRWSSCSAEDARILPQPEIRANLLAGAVEAMRQGPRGPAAELQLLFGRPWGFRPQDVTPEVRL